MGLQTLLHVCICFCCLVLQHLVLLLHNILPFIDRLDGAEVRIGNTNPDPSNGNGVVTNTLCGVLPSNIDVGGLSYCFACNGEGRYVSVSLNGTNRILALSEVQVVSNGGAQPS